MERNLRRWRRCWGAALRRRKLINEISLYVFFFRFVCVVCIRIFFTTQLLIKPVHVLRVYVQVCLCEGELIKIKAQKLSKIRERGQRIKPINTQDPNWLFHWWQNIIPI